MRIVSGAALCVLTLLALGAGGCGDKEAAAHRRGAPRYTRANGEAARVERFYRLFTTGDQTTIAGQQIPTWQRVGEQTLMAMGRPALDYLLSPERFRQYRTSPNILTNLLRMMPHMRSLKDHPRLTPFLTYWLDEQNCPKRMEGNDWVTLWRKQIFGIFTIFPRKDMGPACVGELERKQDDPRNDLRTAAILVLLVTHQPAPVLERYDELPQVLQSYALARLHELASPTMPEEDRAVAEAAKPVLRKALVAEDSYERIYAAATLLRLDAEGMADLMLEEFERANKAGNEDAAWVAVRWLAMDRRDERAFAICWTHARETDGTFASTIANELLRKVWLQRKDVQARMWKRMESSAPGRPLDLPSMSKLLLVDRARVVRFLKAAILGTDPVWKRDALRFVTTGRGVPEAGPWILKLLQKETRPKTRANLHGMAVRLRADGIGTLLRADLDDARDPSLQQVAAMLLIALNDAPGLARIAERVAAGERLLLDALFEEARRKPDAVPDALVPAVQKALLAAKGEEQRLKALFILRVRGRLDDVEQGLVEAYRREPSRRVARQIETTLEELAHR